MRYTSYVTWYCNMIRAKINLTLDRTMYGVHLLAVQMQGSALHIQRWNAMYEASKYINSKGLKSLFFWFTVNLHRKGKGERRDRQVSRRAVVSFSMTSWRLRYSLAMKPSFRIIFVLRLAHIISKLYLVMCEPHVHECMVSSSSVCTIYGNADVKAESGICWLGDADASYNFL